MSAADMSYVIVFKERGEQVISSRSCSKSMTWKASNLKHGVELTKDERAQALCYLFYLKEMRDSTVKVRECADCRPWEA
jgi:hypothetical protein